MCMRAIWQGSIAAAAKAAENKIQPGFLQALLKKAEEKEKLCPNPQSRRHST